ncbi:MAG: hypothetical protein NTX65_15900 [Ignavibacteriales bacterium]|nr:hypothetical protein [Ignavibacteriales bacterium]
MKTIMKIFLAFVLFQVSIPAQQTTFQDSLLDQMTGQWVLQGTIAGEETTHDVDIKWVLGHQYIQVHEISRDKNSNGEAMYEAIVFIGWDEKLNQYACLWLDVTGGGGLSAQAIAHAERDSNKMAFLFHGSDNSLFHTTFVYDSDSGTWQWVMDGEENGKLQSFARVKLTRE